MPKLTKNQIPAHRRHKTRNIAVVTWSGQNFYLGPYGSEASKAEYDRVVAEWIANGRCGPSSCAESTSALTVSEVIAAYWQYAIAY